MGELGGGVELQYRYMLFTTRIIPYSLVLSTTGEVFDESKKTDNRSTAGE